MAANLAADRATSDTTSPQDISDFSQPQEQLPSSTPVEMSGFLSKSRDNAAAPPEDRIPSPPPAPSIPAEQSSHSVFTDPISSSIQSNPAKNTTESATPASLPPPAAPSSNAAVTRIYSTAIGPSSDQPIPPSKDLESAGPTLLITLLLTSGARHPFKLDGKYLTKRNVDVPDNDPFNLSVYKLKELILREWREEWEAKPSSPNFIRLISFGKLLDDKAPLKDSRLNYDAPNVVHMTIKPQDYVEEEEHAKGSKASYNAGGEGTERRSPGCRCVVM